jgi:hypothetical protein
MNKQTDEMVYSAPDEKTGSGELLLALLRM